MSIQAFITMDNEDASFTDPLSALPSLQMAFGTWSNLLNGNAAINVTLRIEPGDFLDGLPSTWLAVCDPAFRDFGMLAENVDLTISARELYVSTLAYQLINGVSTPDLEPQPVADITLYLNGDLVNTLSPSDLFSLFLHEIGHAIGFNGAQASAIPGDPFLNPDISETPFDEHIVTRLDGRFFDGRIADQTNGGPVQLAEPVIFHDSIYHLLDPADLMYPLSNGAQEPSNVDLAILTDLGLRSLSDQIAPNGTTWYRDFQPMSSDGRYVVFQSTDRGLVEGDTNNLQDIFVYDRITNSIERVSIADNGAQANNPSYDPTISADGRYITFFSAATNLVAGAPLGYNGYLYDRSSHHLELLPNTLNSQLNLVISPDGEHVAYKTFHEDIYTYDRANPGAATLVAHNVFGTDIQLSSDGGFLVYDSLNSTVSGHVFIYDRSNQTTLQIPDSHYDGTPSISADGRYISFLSADFDNVTGDLKTENVLVYDRVNGTPELVSFAEDGVHPNDHAIWASISGDGRYVVYTMDADLNEDLSGPIYVYDRIAHTTTQAREGMFAQISPDGQHIVIDHEDGSISIIDTPHFGITVDSVVLDRDTGSSNSDFVTQDGRVTLLGTVSGTSPNASVEVFDGTTSLGLATVSDGAWWLDTTLSEGNHDFSAKLTDLFGDRANTSEHPHSVTVDTTPPLVIDHLANDTGTSSTDRITSIGTVTGTGDPNATVHLAVDGNLIDLTADDTGSWTFTPVGLSDGGHTITASEADLAGNVGTTSLTFTLDTTAPVDEVTKEALNKNGSFTLTGSAEAGTSIQVYDGSTLLGSTVAGSNAQWSFTTGVLSSGVAHTFSSTATDAAGNVGNSGIAFYGTNGSNTVFSTAHNDYLTGADGPDTFVFSSSHFGRDTVTDFTTTGKNHDLLQFDHTVFVSAADVVNHTTQVGKDVVITLDAADTITLLGVHLNQLTSSDFHII